jgi:hypothetical protein
MNNNVYYSSKYIYDSDPKRGRNQSDLTDRDFSEGAGTKESHNIMCAKRNKDL